MGKDSFPGYFCFYCSQSELFDYNEIMHSNLETDVIMNCKSDNKWKKLDDKCKYGIPCFHDEIIRREKIIKQIKSNFLRYRRKK